MVNKSPVEIVIELERAVDKMVHMSLAIDRMVEDLAKLRGANARWVRNYYGIGEKS